MAPEAGSSNHVFFTGLSVLVPCGSWSSGSRRADESTTARARWLDKLDSVAKVVWGAVKRLH